MTNRLPPAEMQKNVEAAMARDKIEFGGGRQQGKTLGQITVTSDDAAFRRASMARLRVNANQLRAAMVSIADNDVEFTKLYGSVIKDDLAWEQMLIDLETMANLARIEE